KWVAAKLLPGRYGDQLALTGKDGAALIPDGEERARRLPQLVQVLALLLPGVTNSELFDTAGKLLDRAGGVPSLPIQGNQS
ncbi:MAG: hypothetical protein ACREFB_19020, partial [Stellaceae bacterium]